MVQQQQQQQQPHTQQAQGAIPGGGLFGSDLIVVTEDEGLKWLAWEQAKDAWLESKRRRSGRNNTVRAYECAVRQFFAWAEEAYDHQVPPWHVTPLMAEEWVRHLYDVRALADSTVNLKLAALASMYDYVQRRYVATTPDGCIMSLWPADHANPFDAVERVQVDPYSRAVYPTTEELKTILAAINCDCLTGCRDFALLYTFSVTCRRASELLELRWGDIEHAPLDEAGNRVYRYNIRKKGADKVRKAILDRNCYQAITAYLRADGRIYTDPETGEPVTPEDDEFIFVPLRPEVITRLNPDLDVDDVAVSHISSRFANDILKKYARRAGVDEAKAHLHALRHAGARLRFQQMEEHGDINPLELMQLLQHSSLAVTQVYIGEVLKTPKDAGGRRAADALLPKGPRRKPTPPPPEQPELL